jgi:hypothetical protein
LADFTSQKSGEQRSEKSFEQFSEWTMIIPNFWWGNVQNPITYPQYCQYVGGLFTPNGSCLWHSGSHNHQPTVACSHC